MKYNTKLIGLAVVSVVIVGALFISISSLFKHKRPNVLLIVLDTTRADHLSCYGHDRKTSPYIDRLGSEGVIFDHAYAAACWTLPSHASLLTGLEPLEAGATSETLHLPESNKTIAEILNEAGYDTAAFICNSWVSKERGFGQGFDDYHEMWRASNNKHIIVSLSKSEVATTEKVKEWLNHRTDKQNPFFAFINLNGVHLPYQPPEPYRSDFLRDDYDKADIRPDAALELTKVISAMRQVPDMEIAVRSHTDSRGEDAYNLKLSDRRAKSTVAYIISQGINSNRITGQGFGETEIINGCDNNATCSPEQHQLNRI